MAAVSKSGLLVEEKLRIPEADADGNTVLEGRVGKAVVGVAEEGVSEEDVSDFVNLARYSVAVVDPQPTLVYQILSCIRNAVEQNELGSILEGT